jgi:transcription initiation factor TFIIIB Brf1 subunit/transcription initiation factor TFIIB
LSPSALDGVSSELEFAHRVFGCELAQEMTVLLCMPQVCAVTAQTLLQHFYYRRSLRLFDAYVVAMACVFLAGKVEEHTRAMRDILNVCHNCMLRRLDKQQKPLQRGGELYSSWKAALIRCERFVLIDLGFRVYDLSNEHPHKFILYYVLALGGGEELAQRSWNYLNDSLRLDLCVRHSPESIACAAILLAASDLSFQLPVQSPWTEVFSSDKVEVEAIAARISGLYRVVAGTDDGKDLHLRWPTSLVRELVKET